MQREPDGEVDAMSAGTSAKRRVCEAYGEDTPVIVSIALRCKSMADAFCACHCRPWLTTREIRCAASALAKGRACGGSIGSGRRRRRTAASDWLVVAEQIGNAGLELRLAIEVQQPRGRPGPRRTALRRPQAVLGVTCRFEWTRLCQL